MIRLPGDTLAKLSFKYAQEPAPRPRGRQITTWITMMKKRLSELGLEWERACRLADDRERELEKLHRPRVSLVSYFNISNSGYLQFFLVPFQTVSFILHNVQNVQNMFNDDDDKQILRDLGESFSNWQKYYTCHVCMIKYKMIFQRK